MVLTKKQELFAQNLFAGKTQRVAWVNAGYSSKYSMAVLDSKACHLANLGKVRARFFELNEATLSPLVAEVTERKEILTEITRGRLGDFVDTDGELLEVRADGLKSAALQEIKTTRFQGGKDGRATEKTTTIKLHNPISAIDLLNKMDKLYAEGASVNIDNRTLVINVKSEEAKELTERVIEGERTEK